MPGYYLKNTILTDYDESGMPSLRIAADRIDQIDHGSEVVLFGVHVDYQPPTGQAWVLTGDVAHVAPGGGAIDVTGNVRLQGQAEGRAGDARARDARQAEGRAAAPLIRTDALRYDVPLALATTQSEVHIDFGSQTVSARGLVAHLKERTLLLQSRVNGRFHP